MAGDDKQQANAPQVIQVVTPNPGETAAKAMVEAQSLGLSETEPGGVYVVNGQKVDAYGDPLEGKK